MTDDQKNNPQPEGQPRPRRGKPGRRSRCGGIPSQGRASRPPPAEEAVPVEERPAGAPACGGAHPGGEPAGRPGRGSRPCGGKSGQRPRCGGAHPRGEPAGRPGRGSRPRGGKPGRRSRCGGAHPGGEPAGRSSARGPGGRAALPAPALAGVVLRRAAPGSLRPAVCPGWVLPLCPGRVPAPAGPALVRPARRAAAQAAPEEDVPGAEGLFVDRLRLDRRGGSGFCRVCRQLGGGRAPAGGLSGGDAARGKPAGQLPGGPGRRRGAGD